MSCPVCGATLSQQAAGPITADVCRRCGGIWLDRFELRKLDEPSESAGEALLETPRDPAVAVDLDAQRECPKCADGGVMLRHFTSVKRRVTIDECPQCAGVWLDAGELAGIRGEFGSEEERRRAAEAYFSELFDGLLAAEHAKTESELERSRDFARAFRFLCPSAYLPGKQDWGAF